MKIKTAELLGPPLDWAVAKAEGLLDHITFNHEMTHPLVLSKVQVYGPSIFPAQGWPIIDREKVNLTNGTPAGSMFKWHAWYAGPGKPSYQQSGSTSLIAAMRCFVASKLGDEVDVPEELVS